MLSVHFYEASHNSTVRGFDAHGVNSETGAVGTDVYYAGAKHHSD